MYLNLQEVEKKVKNMFSKMEESVEEKYRVKNDLFFIESIPNYLPGTYVYVDEKGYHMDFVGDRGGIVAEEIYTEINDLLFQLCWDRASSISIEFAAKNKESGKDWRRIMFKKILELLKILSDNYYEQGKEKINIILSENPYNDSLLG